MNESIKKTNGRISRWASRVGRSFNAEGFGKAPFRLHPHVEMVKRTKPYGGIYRLDPVSVFPREGPA